MSGFADLISSGFYTKHNSAIDKYIEDMPPKAKNIRKNQTQVDINGNKVGSNRPDVQYDLNG